MSYEKYLTFIHLAWVHIVEIIHMMQHYKMFNVFHYKKKKKILLSTFNMSGIVQGGGNRYGQFIN